MHTISANGRLRARGLGLSFSGTPGICNAITDVAGVEVGYCTLIAGKGKLVPGIGPVRTGVTAILPRGRFGGHVPCAAGSFSFNGNGEMSGLAWIEEAGELQTPITITNTHSCGVARDATLRWMLANGSHTAQDWGLPVAAETYDGELNDINGFHVRDEHVFTALDSAKSGAIAMGNVGGGTGMLTYDFKGGSSSASRMIVIDGQRYTVGVFVQSNFGKREDLMILGVHVGKHLDQLKLRSKEQGSIIVIVATDGPLLPHQLKRLARRVPLGLARTGTIGGNGSGDIFLAFSTGNADALAASTSLRHGVWMSQAVIDHFFRAVVEATEEAVIDAMVTGETMSGQDDNCAIALPHDELLALLKRYGR
jgi:D-aminopeptidase